MGELAHLDTSAVHKGCLARKATFEPILWQAFGADI